MIFIRIIYNKSTCPYFNLAAEEYLAKNCTEDIFMLWRNGAAVVIGKNQEPLIEVDLDFVKRENIPVVRRITGGGAVFHDIGNINYTFITKGAGELDFKRFATPVIEALEKMGIASELGGRNDIVAEGFKISGNAQCRVQTKDGFVTLHHGTLLFSADLSVLSAALKPSPLKLESKGIKSVSSRVKNIVTFENYTGPFAPEGFIQSLFHYVAGGKPEMLSDNEVFEIEKLADEKYRTWEWNFGGSPAFESCFEERFSFGTLMAYVNCSHGRIEKIKLSGDFFGDGVSLLETLLEGVVFDREAVAKKLEGAHFSVSDCIFGADVDSICALLFPKDR